MLPWETPTVISSVLILPHYKQHTASYFLSSCASIQEEPLLSPCAPFSQSKYHGPPPARLKCPLQKHTPADGPTPPPSPARRYLAVNIVRENIVNQCRHRVSDS